MWGGRGGGGTLKQWASHFHGLQAPHSPAVCSPPQGLLEGTAPTELPEHPNSPTPNDGGSSARHPPAILLTTAGFVLEGTAPWELPEALLGGLRLTKLDLSTAKKVG